MAVNCLFYLQQKIQLISQWKNYFDFSSKSRIFEILIFFSTKIQFFLLSNKNIQFCLCSYTACSYPAKKFLFCQKVLIAHRGSFCAEKFLLRTSFDESEKAPLSRSRAMYWQKFFIKRWLKCLRFRSVRNKIIYDVRTILNNYLKKSFLAGALVKNINAQ